MQMVAAYSEHIVCSYDGARIAYQVAGDGPALVLANGLGGNAAAWHFLFRRFSPRHKVLSWDYSGLYHSGPPPSRDRLGPAGQARDLLTLLEAEKVDRFVIAGWSMGVQVALEVYRLMPARVAGLIAINGVPGRPFDTAFGSRFSRRLLPAAVRLWGRGHRVVTPLLRGAVGWKGLLPLLKRLKLVGAMLDDDVFLEVADGFVGMDFDVYCATMDALGRHDAWDVVPTIRVPALIIAGDHDMLTPLAEARRMAGLIPHARLVILPGATHYAPVEYADDVGREVEALLGQCGLTRLVDE